MYIYTHTHAANSALCPSPSTRIPCLTHARTALLLRQPHPRGLPDRALPRRALRLRRHRARVRREGQVLAVGARRRELLAARARQARAVPVLLLRARRRAGHAAGAGAGGLRGPHVVLGAGGAHGGVWGCDVCAEYPRVVSLPPPCCAVLRGRGVVVVVVVVLMCAGRAEEIETPAIHAAWLSTLDLIESLNPAKVIPGHIEQGWELDAKKDVAHNRKYLQLFKEKIQQAPKKPAVKEIFDTFRDAFPDADKNLDFFLGHLSNQFGEGGEIWEENRHHRTAQRKREELEGWRIPLSDE
ncbi:hypothetical protein MPH_09934 [Macrophomina phaseolina MS6]|uniref:Beta-lactamase-like protein n=1 Tax=Macrophomina phaseolina (strain MS6) TaxID=1126212 RepID=K2RJB9_MACPH|nr:hypothetical protein MPH_09934 [Macrophomina phaseolina MS6]